MIGRQLFRQQPSLFDDLGSVRHALSNGHITSLEGLSQWSASQLSRRLEVRPHELRRLEGFLADAGLTLAPDGTDGALMDFVTAERLRRHSR